MSTRQHVNAYLAGYNGPYFPAQLFRLHQLLDKLPFCNGTWLEQISESTGLFNGGFSRPTTSDGYSWFWAAEFTTNGTNRILVLFPWAQDWFRSDGTQSDRSIAVHTQGCNETTAAEVIQKIINAINLATL